MPSQRIGSLCSGYEGIGMAAAEVLGGELAWVADNDPGACKILAHHFPDVPNWGDITTADWGSAEPVDVLTAGFPCQPVSAAGRRAGTGDERWLFDEICAAIGRMGTRPRLLVLENVPGLLSANGGDAMARVVHGLAALGYVGRYRLLRASDVGAPHKRERWFCIAWPAAANTGGERRDGRPRLIGDGRTTAVGQQAGSHGINGSSAPAEDPDGAAGGEWRVAAPGQEASGGARADTRGPGGAPPADTSGAGLEVGAVEHDGPERQAAERGRGDAAADAECDGLEGQRADTRQGTGRETADGGGCGPAGSSSTPAHADGSRRRSEPGQQRGVRLAEREPGDIAWGAYGPAIARWEAILGRLAPSPTEPGRTGQRLSPKFVEFMMGLPEGWVTDVPGLSRNQQLHALGNGVVPQQCALALRLLLPAWLEAAA
jgi:DNA (cytosine-5)-methyltransferase 1